MAHETLHEIVESVLDVVQDSSFSELGTYAEGTISITGMPDAFDTITIYNQTFTFATTRENAGEIEIGTTEDECVANIAYAINTDLDYLSAAADTDADTVTVTAGVKGSQGNLIVFEADAANITLDGSGYLGGTTSGSWGDRIKRIVNQGLKRIAADNKLPELSTDGEVTTVADTSSVALPTDFHWGLDRCWNSTQGKKVSVHRSLGAMLGRYDHAIDQEGPVVDCAIRGSELHYQNIPASGSEETLVLYYQAKPAASNGGQLVDAGDQPTVLPDHLVIPLLKNWTLFTLFNKIEDGNDGQKVNAAHYFSLYQAAIRELWAFIGPNDRGYAGFSA